MKCICSSLLLIAAFAVFLFFVLFSPAGVYAAEIFVPKDYRTIQEAISAATGSASYTIEVDRGIYAGPIIVPNNVTIKGTETAKTFLTGNGSGTIMTIDGTGAISTGTVHILNFTFVNALNGITISNNASTIDITNNVFHGLAGTAITEQYSISTTIANNTFYQNGTAVACTSDITIANNIFSTNATAIADTAPPSTITKITSNAFYPDSSATGTDPVTGDPLFVFPRNHDFHLMEGSPCIERGDDGTDVGASGGAYADTIPFQVSGLKIPSTTDASINLSWDANNCYRVTNTDPTLAGGYNLYVGRAKGVYTGIQPGDETVRPIPVGSSTNYTLTGLTSPTTPLAPPSLDPPSPRDSKLLLTWSAVSGATGYEVHYGISSLDEYAPIDVENTTSYELTGLTNYQQYIVAVSAYARQEYFFVVTAHDNEFVDNTSTPLHESMYSEEKSITIGETRYSDLSNVPSNVYPEPVTAYPALPDSGGRCFIATAAYGNYAAPEVQALRAFRDRYLLTSVPGRMFVRWYYQHGPAAAALLNDHPAFKPMVRAALIPAVGAAIFMTGTSGQFKAIVFLFLGSAIAFGFFRKKLSRTGGLR